MSSGLEAGPDHDLDLAIRQLLEQQAGIQARLAALVAAKHGFDPRRELDMLRTKLRVLEDIVDRNDLGQHIPLLSDVEEARAIQYRCECLELICLQQSMPSLPSPPLRPANPSTQMWMFINHSAVISAPCQVKLVPG
jgi:hypothetical protein